MATHPQQNPPPEASSGLGCLVRLSWMFFGNAALAIVAVLVWEHRASFPSFADLAFWLVVCVLIAIRYVDVKMLKGQTGRGTLATMKHWRRYVLVLIACALAVWGGVHGAAWLWRT